MTFTNSNNPFVGLRPFESHESLLFFGRQQQTLELLQRLHDHHFVAVIGSSGSGKSSLIRAGLIPLLKAGYLVNNRDEWLIAVMKPGQSPISNLAQTVLNQAGLENNGLNTANLAQQIRETGVDAVLAELQPLFKPNTSLFLLVDQFEELFRFAQLRSSAESKDEANDFVNLLLQLVRQAELPIYIVLTMRSDFIGDCAQFFGLPEAMNESQFIVPRLNRIQLRNSIEGPVKLYGGRLNPGLTDRLLNDLQLVKDELPLLQHVLMRIWDLEVDEDRNGQLDLEDYRKTGGLEKALSNHADECLMGMSPSESNLTKKVFQSLTAIDENARKIRRPVRMKELQAITGATNKELLAIINRFIEGDRSFLVISNLNNSDDLLIDISHESLIRQWSTLNDWVNEEAESAKTYLRLTESAALHRERKKDYLSGNELQQVLQWYRSFQPGEVWAERYSPDFKTSMSYLRQSEQEWLTILEEEKKERSNKLRNLRLLLALALLVMVLIGILAYNNYRRNIEISNVAAVNYARNSDFARKANRSTESLLYAAEAVRASRNPDLIQNLLLDIQFRIPDKKLENIFSHSDAVYSVAFSPDQKTLLTAGYDNTARLWDRITGMQKGVPMVHTEPVKTAVFSPDGKWILTAGDDSTARIWDAADGRTLLSSVRHLASVNSAVFSPDGKHVLTASNDSTARIWDRASGRQTGYLRHTGFVNSAVYNPAGDQVVTAGGDSTARLWSAADGRQIGMPMYHEGSVYRAVFSPDGKHILTAGLDGTARLWDVRTGKLAGPVMKHDAAVYSATFSMDGKKIVTASYDSTAKVWDAVSLRQTGATLHHNESINSAEFSADGKLIVTSGYDKTARLWNAETGKQIGNPIRQEGIIYKAVFSPDSKQIATVSGDKTARLWSFSVDTSNHPILRQPGIVYSAEYSADQKKIVTAGADSTVRIYDAATGKQIGRPIQLQGLVYSAVFSNNGERILTAGSDGRVQVWDAIRGSIIKTFPRQPSAVINAVYSPDNKLIVTAGSAGDAKVWDAASGNPVCPPLLHDGPVYTAVFSKDGKRIVTASYDSTARVWDARSGTQIGKPITHKNNIFCASFSPDGKRILTGSIDGSARLWDLETRAQVGPALMHDRAVKTVYFSPDGKRILTASVDSTARLWETGSGKQIGLSFRNSSPLDKAVFSPDGNKILTAGYDGSVSTWNLQADTDLPRDIWLLQIKVFTGAELDIESGEIKYIGSPDWYQLKRDYESRGLEHYKNCLFPAYNVWAQYRPVEARMIRP